MNTNSFGPILIITLISVLATLGASAVCLGHFTKVLPLVQTVRNPRQRAHLTITVLVCMVLVIGLDWFMVECVIHGLDRLERPGRPCAADTNRVPKGDEVVRALIADLPDDGERRRVRYWVSLRAVGRALFAELVSIKRWLVLHASRVLARQCRYLARTYLVKAITASI